VARGGESAEESDQSASSESTAVSWPEVKSSWRPTCLEAREMLDACNICALLGLRREYVVGTVRRCGRSLSGGLP
jgi:hypothetical protein